MVSAWLAMKDGSSLWQWFLGAPASARQAGGRHAPAATRYRLLLAALIYLIVTAAFFGFAAGDRLSTHTPYNHFAHLAQAWLNGDLHLEGGPPDYARNNDFAKYEGRWFVTFPPLPALILLPFVWLAGSPEQVFDGQIWIWVAGLGPALLLLALERLSQGGLSARVPWQNALLALSFALGTVYWFTAVQGTVWFAAHVVSVTWAAAYLYFSVGARNPLLAGLCLGLGFMTRAPLLFAFPLFALEALRVCSSARLAAPTLTSGPVVARLAAKIRGLVNPINFRRLLQLYLLFSLPILVCLAVTLLHNYLRFDDALDTGYKHLTVAWQARMKKWGLFDYHYLAKNLGVITSSLPWVGKDTLFRVNTHGLALWLTTPMYFWLLWPKERPAIHWGLWLTVGAVALPTLFYQNTGWAQFGYRFSNDYAVFLFALLAIGGVPLRFWFSVALLWATVVNGFGAWTFDRAEYKKYYYQQGSQKTLFQPD